MSQATLSETDFSVPYTPARLQDDKQVYGPQLAEAAWLLDAVTADLLHIEPLDSIPTTGIVVDVAAQFDPASPSGGAKTPSSETRSLGSIADVAGGIELGELVPLRDGSTLAVDDGVLSVDEDSVSYVSHLEETDYPTVQRVHATTSKLRAVDRGTVATGDQLPSPPVTFIPSSALNQSTSADAAQQDSAGGSTFRPIPSPVIDQGRIAPTPTTTDRAYTDPIRPDSLRVGDAVDLLERVPPESIQLSCFSPPYSIGKQYGEFADDLEMGGWYDLMTDVFAQLFRATKPDGKVVVNVGKSFSSADEDGRFYFHPLAAYIKYAALSNGFDFLDEAIWTKNNFANRGGGPLLGSYPSPSNMMITARHEHVLVFRKFVTEDYYATRSLPEEGTPRREQSKLTKSRWKELTQSLWDIEPVTQSNLDVEHNAVYPEELAKRAVQLYSFKGDTVLDPFVGIGTTAVAAKRAGRQYMGFDQNEEYIDYAKERLEHVEYDDDEYVDSRPPSDS